MKGRKRKHYKPWGTAPECLSPRAWPAWAVSLALVVPSNQGLVTPSPRSGPGAMLEQTPTQGRSRRQPEPSFRGFLFFRTA